MRTDIRSARPRLLRLDNALLLLAIRPSLSLWTSVDGVSWSAMTNLAKAHNDALPQDSPLRFCPEFAASNHSYTSNGHIAQDTWMSTGYSSLVRLSGTEAIMTGNGVLRARGGAQPALAVAAAAALPPIGTSLLHAHQRLHQ